MVDWYGYFLCVDESRVYRLYFTVGSDVILGAQVIVSMFEAIPFIGETLHNWILGDFMLSDAALNRFFAYHVVTLPVLIVVLVFVHIIALHEVGSNNPDGIEIKENKNPATKIPVDGIPFHPYYTVKDIFGVIGFLIVFCGIIFFAPEMGDISWSTIILFRQIHYRHQIILHRFGISHLTIQCYVL